MTSRPSNISAGSNWSNRPLFSAFFLRLFPLSLGGSQLLQVHRTGHGQQDPNGQVCGAWGGTCEGWRVGTAAARAQGREVFFARKMGGVFCLWNIRKTNWQHWFLAVVLKDLSYLNVWADYVCTGTFPPFSQNWFMGKIQCKHLNPSQAESGREATLWSLGASAAGETPKYLRTATGNIRPLDFGVPQKMED